MKKIIKKYGGSLIILFDKEDCKIFNIKEGDIVNISIKKLKNNRFSHQGVS